MKFITSKKLQIGTRFQWSDNEDINRLLNGQEGIITHVNEKVVRYKALTGDYSGRRFQKSITQFLTDNFYILDINRNGANKK